MTEFETGGGASLQTDDGKATQPGTGAKQPPMQARAERANVAGRTQKTLKGARPMAKKPALKKAAPKAKPSAKAKSNGGAAEAAAAAEGAAKTQDTVFTHPSPAADVQRTVASSLGEIVWLMSQSPAHKTFFISDLEWMIMVPVMLQQFRIFYDQQKPIGVALWGFVNEDVEARLASGNAKLQPQDWKSGDKLWVVEIIAPFGGHEEMLQDLKSQVFLTTTLKFVRNVGGELIASSI